MKKNAPPITPRQQMMRKIFPWAFVAFLFLFTVTIVFVFSFSLAAALIALFLLLGWAVHSIGKRGLRKRSSIFTESTWGRILICSVLLLFTVSAFWHSVDGIQNGVIKMYIHGRYSSGPGVTLTFHRADDPAGFWEVVGGHAGLGFITLYLVIMEIFIAIRQRQPLHHRPPPPARLDS